MDGDIKPNGGYVMRETKSSTTVSGEISLAGLLTIAFIVLKLTGYIDWSWWWVLSPVCITFAITLALVVASVLAAQAYEEVQRE